MTAPDRAAVEAAVEAATQFADAMRYQMDRDDGCGGRDLKCTSVSEDGEFVHLTEPQLRAVLDELKRRRETEANLRALLAHMDQQNDETTAFMRAEFEAAIAEREVQRDEVRAELKQVEQRFAELSDGMTVAVELLDKFTAETPCTEGGDTCRAHGYARKPCPHPLGRQVVDAWRAVQAEASQSAQDGSER